MAVRHIKQRGQPYRPVRFGQPPLDRI